MNFVLPDPGPPNAEFEQPADAGRIERTAEALRARGFKAHVAADSAEAKRPALPLRRLLRNCLGHCDRLMHGVRLRAHSLVTAPTDRNRNTGCREISALNSPTGLSGAASKYGRTMRTSRT